MKRLTRFSAKTYIMKNSILAISAICIQHVLHAQHNFHASLDFGISDLVVERTGDYNLLHWNKLENKLSPSYTFEIGYGYALKSFILETGLRYSAINGRQQETMNMPTQFPQGSTLKFTENIQRTAQYIQIPLTINYKYQNLQLGLGMYAAWMASNSYTSEVRENDGLIMSMGSGNDLKRFDYGYLAKLGMDINDRFSLFLNATIGLPNVNTFNMRNGIISSFGWTDMDNSMFLVKDELRMRQFTLGLRYRIFQKNKES